MFSDKGISGKAENISDKSTRLWSGVVSPYRRTTD